MFGVVLALGFVGCGQDADNQATPAVLSVEHVRQEFSRLTGYTLTDQRTPAVPGVPEVHRLDPRESDSLSRKYGSFSIFVYKTPKDARESLRGSTPDVNGHYWTKATIERGPNAGETYWTVETFYPRNVVLVSFVNRRGSGLSAQQKRLGAVLEAISAAKDA
jgi:hypothetical protein